VISWRKTKTRLRRATAIETGLLQIHSGAIGRSTQEDKAPVRQSAATTMAAIAELMTTSNLDSDNNARGARTHNVEIAARFLALNRADQGVFERLNRYETALWRQLGQLLVTLEFLRRYPPS
jgi:hypothetical protein